MYPRTASPTIPLDIAGSRSQQVAILLSHIPACRPLNRDQSLFEVSLHLRDGRHTGLRISLPPNFPQNRPGLSMTHPIRHAWVDDAGRMSFPSLLRWSPAQSTLAGVVEEALAELTGSQPVPAHPSQQQHHTQGRASPPVTTAQPQHAQHAQHPQHAQHAQRPQQPQRYQEAAVPTEFPELAAMSADELHRLLVDEGAYRELVQRLAAQSGSGAVQRQLRLGNADLANANLAREAEIAELRNQIAIIRSSEFALAKEAFDEKTTRQAAVLAKLAPASLTKALAAAAEAVDAEAEAACERLAGGELSVEAFQAQHLKLRQLFHARDIKRQAAEQTLC